MSRRNIYDNWERLVVAVLRRDELWQLCHEQSRSPSISSVSSDFSSSCFENNHTHANSQVSNDSVSSDYDSSCFEINNTHENSQVANDDASSNNISAVREVQYKPGVYITLAALPDGSTFVKRARFSKVGFEEEHKPVTWWFKNRERVYKRYNARGGDARVSRPSFIGFSWSPLIDQFEGGDDPIFLTQKQSVPPDSNPRYSNEHLLISKNKEKLIIPQPQADDISETEKIVLMELKQLVQKALNRHEFGTSSSSPKVDESDYKNKKMPEDHTLEAIADAKAPEEVVIWGVKLFEDEKTDTILLKFLRAQYYNVKDAFSMFQNTLQWRKKVRIDDLVEEDDLTISEFESVTFMHGYSKEGHPVCYNVYRGFHDEIFYQKMFFGEEKTPRFLRWRVQFIEKNVRNLDFNPGGISTIVQVNDLKNFPGHGKRELRQANVQSLQLFQDHYPEFLAKQVFINTPWWYVAFNKMISPLLTARTKSKFVFAGPSLSMATLLKYISSEQIPTQYGGLSKGEDFGRADDDHSVTEIMVKPFAKHIEKFPVTQPCLVSWEVRVVGWEVTYVAEFVPSVKDGHTITIEETKRINCSTHEQVIHGSFTARQPGKVVVIITAHT